MATTIGTLHAVTPSVPVVPPRGGPVNVGKIRRMLASAGFDEDRTCGECLLPVPAQARVCGHCGRDLVVV